jgi:fused signal recognition particle receptor
LFESLKKKFSRTSNKLTDELKEEAKEENNIEDSKDIKTESDNKINDSNNKEKTGFLSSFRKKKNANSDITESKDDIPLDEVIKEDEELIEETEKEIAEPFDEPSKMESGKDLEEIIENQKHLDTIKKSEDEVNEKKSRFFSRFKKDNKDDSKEDTGSNQIDVDDSIKDDSSTKKSGFWSRFKKDKVSESNDEEFVDEVSNLDVDENVEEESEKSGFLSKIKKDKDNEKSGIFSFIREKTISEKHVEDILWELEMGLLEGDVAIDVANTVVDSVKNDLIGQKIKRSNDIQEYTFEALRNAVSKIIDIPGKTMTEMIEEKKANGEPLVIMFVGINGTGKTTTIGKIANYYLKKGYTPVIAASDTFRAGAIEQISHHAENLDIKIIKHQKGSDPAAVAYDAVEHAKSKNKELVLIDTAGRMQNNTNLMDEMKKINRVAKPDLVVFVGDALTGNDATEQASKFNDAIGVDGVILTKADADSKGGASLSIGYVIKKPILFLGMGQGYDDIKEYDSEWMLNQLFSTNNEEIAINEDGDE